MTQVVPIRPIPAQTQTRRYAGFLYNVLHDRLSACPGQHPVAGRTRNLALAQLDYDTEQGIEPARYEPPRHQNYG